MINHDEWWFIMISNPVGITSTRFLFDSVWLCISVPQNMRYVRTCWRNNIYQHLMVSPWVVQSFFEIRDAKTTSKRGWWLSDSNHLPKHPGQLPELGDKNTACKSSNPQSQNRHVFFIVFFFKYTLIIETDFRNPITSHHSHLSFCHCCSRFSSFKQQLGITSNTEVRIWSCTACQKDGRWSPPEAVAMDRIARFS